MKLRFLLLLLFVILTCASVQSKGSWKKGTSSSTSIKNSKSWKTSTTRKTPTKYNTNTGNGSGSPGKTASKNFIAGETGGHPTTTTKSPNIGSTRTNSSGHSDLGNQKTTPHSVSTSTAAPTTTKNYPHPNSNSTKKPPEINKDHKKQNHTTTGNKPNDRGSNIRPTTTTTPSHVTRANESQLPPISNITPYPPLQSQVSYHRNSTSVIFIPIPQNNDKRDNQIVKETVIYTGVNPVVNRIINSDGHYHHRRYHYYERRRPVTTSNPVSTKPSQSGKITPPHTFQHRITNEELQSISEELFNKDEFNAYKYISLNKQSHSTGDYVSDQAARPLFQVTPIAYTIPTVQAIRSLYQHYIPDSRVKENITRERRMKENVLLDIFLTTNVMSITMKWLYKHGFVKDDEYEMKDMLKRLWFTQYDGTSSAFERVFAAEIFNGTDVLGVQDWIYFDYHESNKRIDYLGFVDMLQFGNKAAMWKVDFRFDGTLRHNGTVFVGTSPELEMALYTICYYARPRGVCPISLGGTKLNLYTYSYTYFDEDTIDLALPLF